MTRPDDVDQRVTVTWRELLAETESLIDDAQHARWICETATSSTPDEFRGMLDEPAGQRAVAHLDAMVARVRAGEPLQYVLGAWAFRRLDLAVDARVLIPRPETELVAEVAIEVARAVGPTRRVLDMGTGSGAIGLALADELPIDGTTVWISDVSADALAVAQANLAGLGRAARNVRVAEGSWFGALPEGERFDMIVSNPPYVAVGSADVGRSVTDWEPSAALFSGPDGLDDLRVIVAEAPAWLRAGGWLVVEHGHDQGAAVSELFWAAGFVDVETRQDFAGLDRIGLGRRPA
jgi:release factor glutamine methyltransferase